ncbi:MAG: dicarboxylate/amino acid:cation symporter [Verrucomicrobiales bacterium]|nr:dicarboxylate/amino acid:cation symporter [Verrucomicrobiales bacterium]
MFLLKLKPHWQILIALALAAIAGAALGHDSHDANGQSGFGHFVIESCRFFGTIFMSALKMVIVPLIVSSIVTGIAGLGKMEGFGRMGLKTLMYYALTSLLAILIGLAVVNVMKPGFKGGEPNPVIRKMFDNEAQKLSENPNAKVEAASERASNGTKTILDVFKSMVPTNIVKAAAEGQMLGLIFFSIVFGAAMTHMKGESAEVMQHFFVALNDLMITITRGVMIFAPIGVFALIVPVMAETGLSTLFGTLLKYFLVVLLALGIHMFVVLPILLKTLGRVSPWRHFKAMKEAMLTAFSTSSSSATLPVTMRCVIDNSGVSRRTTSFVLPLGATVNMDGTALYECVAVIFTTQVLGYPLTMPEQFAIVFMALITSIGVAGVPSASLVAILIIFKSANIPGLNPAAAMAVLLAVDRLLDMSRTVVNIFSDSCGAVIIGRSEGERNILQGNKKDIFEKAL